MVLQDITKINSGIHYQISEVAHIILGITNIISRLNQVSNSHTYKALAYDKSVKSDLNIDGNK